MLHHHGWTTILRGNLKIKNSKNTLWSWLIVTLEMVGSDDRRETGMRSLPFESTLDTFKFLSSPIDPATYRNQNHSHASRLCAAQIWLHSPILALTGDDGAIIHTTTVSWLKRDAVVKSRWQKMDRACRDDRRSWRARRSNFLLIRSGSPESFAFCFDIFILIPLYVCRRSERFRFSTHYNVIVDFLCGLRIADKEAWNGMAPYCIVPYLFWMMWWGG
jgi:hypothetical protein